MARKTIKIYVVGPAKHYSKWIYDHELTDNMEEAHIVLFTGGEDVDPSLYGCEKHYTTGSNIQRDLEEKAIFEKVRPDQLCIGICRGLRNVVLFKHGELLEHLRWQSAA